MIEKLIKCPKCAAEDSCFAQAINETKFGYNCFQCGYISSDFMVEGEYDFAQLEETMPELYKDLKYKDEQGRVWYPNVINMPEKGVVFINGTSKEDWQWASIKSIPLTKKEIKSGKFKGQTYKSDASSLTGHGQDGFYDACDSLGFFELENVQE